MSILWADKYFSLQIEDIKAYGFVSIEDKRTVHDGLPICVLFQPPGLDSCAGYLQWANVTRVVVVFFCLVSYSNF